MAFIKEIPELETPMPVTLMLATLMPFQLVSREGFQQVPREEFQQVPKEGFQWTLKEAFQWVPMKAFHKVPSQAPTKGNSETAKDTGSPAGTGNGTFAGAGDGTPVGAGEETKDGEATDGTDGHGNPVIPMERVSDVTIAGKTAAVTCTNGSSEEEIVFVKETGDSNGGGDGDGSSSSSSTSSESSDSTKSGKHGNDPTVTAHIKSAFLEKQFSVQLGKFKKGSGMGWFPKKFNKLCKFSLDGDQIDSLLTGDSKIMHETSTTKPVSCLHSHMAAVMLNKVPTANTQKLTPLLEGVTFSCRTQNNQWKHPARSQQGWTALGKHAFKPNEPVEIHIDPGSIFPTCNEPNLDLHLIDNLSPVMPTSRRLKTKKKKSIPNGSPLPVQKVNVPQGLQSASPVSEPAPRAMVPGQSPDGSSPNSVNGSIPPCNDPSEQAAVDPESVDSNDSFKIAMADCIAGMCDLIDGMQAQVCSKEKDSPRKPSPGPAGQCKVIFGVQDSSPALRAAIASAGPEDTFNLNLLPKDVADEVNAGEDSNINSHRESLTRFNNQLTIQHEKDEPPRPRECNFVLFPPGHNKFFISQSGHWCNTDEISSSNLKRFHSNFPICHDSHASDFWNFHTCLELHCSQCNHCVHPIDDVRRCDALRGFVVGCHLDGSNVDFPVLLQPDLSMCGSEILKQLQSKNALPPDLQVCVKHVNPDVVTELSRNCLMSVIQPFNVSLRIAVSVLLKNLTKPLKTISFAVSSALG